MRISMTIKRKDMKNINTVKPQNLAHTYFSANAREKTLAHINSSAL
jgi:hypothetical protein